MPGEDTLEHLRDKQIFTTGEAAEVCKVSQQTIIRCFDNGRLQGFRVPGSRFRRIPRAELIRFMRENEIPLDNLGLGARHLLLVDADADLLGRLGGAFPADSPWQFVQAPSAFEAGLELEHLVPEAVLLDAGLAGLDAADAVRAIRARTSLSATLVIVTGGAADEDRLRAARAAGADAVLRKPFDLSQLRQLLPAVNGQ